MRIAHTKDTMSEIYVDALRIRHQVFMVEQKVPQHLEIDQNEASCVHFVLYKDENAVATCRLLPLANGQVKLQRMAVLKEYRKQALGQATLQAAEQFCQKNGYFTITLGAQVTAIPFYERLGYTTYGDTFLDAGIQHVMMTKNLTDSKNTL